MEDKKRKPKPKTKPQRKFPTKKNQMVGDRVLFDQLMGFMVNIPVPPKSSPSDEET